jgi:hypothetical protein
VLTGLPPGVTVTVSKVEAPAWTLLGFAAPVPVGDVENELTINAMLKFPVRLCASLTVQGSE